MAIRGSLREASLPDVLQLLTMGKKTGCLSVTHRHAFGSIYFDKGRISYASIVNRRDRLGDILVKHGLISPQDLEAAITIQSMQPERRIGEILVSERMLAREELHEHIKRQIEEAVYFLFTWTQGTFSFDADVLPDEQDFLVSINPESLLLEGARRIDEWELIQKKVSSLDLIFALDRAHLAQSNVALSPDQEAILDLLDGARDVAEIVEESGLSEFGVAKAIFELATAGFAHTVGRRQATEVASAESRIAEHRNLGVAFYKSAMYDESVREFRRVLELRPDDDHAEFFLALSATRQGRYDDAIKGFRVLAHRVPNKVAVHVNLAYALERTCRFDEARAALGVAEALAPADGHVRLSLGVLALRRGDLAAARNALDGVPAKGTSAAWYHYAALTAAYAGEHARALQLLREGGQLYPHVAVLANNLGVALEHAGRYDEAALAYERGLHDAPNTAQLHKNAGDLHYRAERFDEALEAYARSVRLAPDLGGDVWLKLGNIRFRRGEQDDASRCWERSLALAPENPMARNNLDVAKRRA